MCALNMCVLSVCVHKSVGHTLSCHVRPGELAKGECGALATPALQREKELLELEEAGENVLLPSLRWPSGE